MFYEVPLIRGSLAENSARLDFTQNFQTETIITKANIIFRLFNYFSLTEINTFCAYDQK